MKTLEKKKVVAQPLVADGKPAKTERNMGVELFRIVSMMLVVWLHVIGQGRILSSVKPLSASYQIALLLQVITYCSVNCYALISGFANVKTEFKFRRFVYLWLETVVLMLLMNTVMHFFVPTVEVTKDLWLMSIFPLTKRPMWYFCAYFFMFPLLPILNKGLLSLKKWQHIMIIVLLQVPTILRLIADQDNYVLSSGYSTIWLICLYVMGAYFRIYGAPKWAKWFVTLPIFFLSAAAAWLFKLIPEQRLADGLIDKEAEWYVRRGALISYVSPCMVIMALMLLLFFMQIKVKHKLPKVIISHLGKATWGVFVLHVGTSFWRYSAFWSGFQTFTEYSAGKMLLAILGAGALTYLALSLITISVSYLFKLLRVYRGVDFLASLPTKLLKKKEDS